MGPTLPLPMEGGDRVVIKKTFIEVEDDATPTGLPATYNSDSVIWSRFKRQVSPMSTSQEQPSPPKVPPVEMAPREPQPLLSSLNKKERLSRSSVSTDDTDTDACERPEHAEQGLVLMRLREPSPETLDAAMNLAVTQASQALDAAGITLERQPLDELLQKISAAEPRPVSLLEAVGAVGESPRSGAFGGETTVMLRNLPNNYSRNMVCAMMDKEGFHGKYDFLYLPIDFRSKASLGYAFVNLINAVEANNFWKTFDGFTKWVLPSAKVCSVSWSGPHQGQESHVERYRDSPIMHGSVPDEFKPVIFEAGTGRRLDFPLPSRKLRAPRRRPATLPGTQGPGPEKGAEKGLPEKAEQRP
ncbi:unnamed protein product [Durusdinium trenchii]|uniref:Mei2-like C-terminal RNA recognition motif domain-containing protein n=1 Tax=Durusdinium trenchii TaxID=1381693 RepID=A0ABP0RZ37_9DINO